MASFSFSFSGDDIEDEDMGGVTAPPSTTPALPPSSETAPAAATAAAAAASSSAFPVQGKPQLPARRHDLQEMLARLPSKIAYGLLRVALAPPQEPQEPQEPQQEGAAAAAAPGWVSLPRRELWDVRVQLMAEDDRMGGDGEGGGGAEGDASVGLGTHDVKTGIYEGGFKSWESSFDLVKVLLQQQQQTTAGAAGPSPSAVASGVLETGGPAHVIELGCGTALPSVALFQWLCSSRGTATMTQGPVAITVADYNPSVLYLVTLPNFLLAWALQQRAAGNPLLQQAISIESEGEQDDGNGGELELTDEVKAAFCAFLAASGITLSFLSGGWSPTFVDLLYEGTTDPKATTTLVLGAETIYSPFALESFSDTLTAILRRERGSSDGSARAMAIIGAKKLYFGVGGSLGDFVVRMRGTGATVRELSEETEGVRRGVVQCFLE